MNTYALGGWLWGLITGFSVGLAVGAYSMARIWDEHRDNIIKYIILTLRRGQQEGSDAMVRMDIISLLKQLQSRGHER